MHLAIIRTDFVLFFEGWLSWFTGNWAVTPEEYKKIKRYATLHGYSMNKYILDCIRERIKQENEEKDLLKLTSSINPVLKELWDNDMDAAYDQF